MSRCRTGQFLPGTNHYQFSSHWGDCGSKACIRCTPGTSTIYHMSRLYHEGGQYFGQLPREEAQTVFDDVAHLGIASGKDSEVLPLVTWEVVLGTDMGRYYFTLEGVVAFWIFPGSFLITSPQSTFSAIRHFWSTSRSSTSPSLTTRMEGKLP